MGKAMKMIRREDGTGDARVRALRLLVEETHFAAEGNRAAGVPSRAPRVAPRVTLSRSPQMSGRPSRQLGAHSNESSGAGLLRDPLHGGLEQYAFIIEYIDARRATCSATCLRRRKVFRTGRTLTQAAHAGARRRSRAAPRRFWCSLRALDHVHGAGVLLHFDVKPENLMVTLTLQIKLTDWGLYSRDPVAFDDKRGNGGAAGADTAPMPRGAARGWNDDVALARIAVLYALSHAERAVAVREERNWLAPATSDLWAAGLTALAPFCGKISSIEWPANEGERAAAKWQALYLRRDRRAAASWSNADVLA